ncbi:hypothetical protein SNE26_21440 [Mucilaginibacter sp. cycad4]|uniref:hypothetical protein n=1 Tax=Mucilaginibacter sp. cycad4 TaxID=3342096 RepID=UPI002AAAF5FB|nr:hypothetical protein [Mucilaginibacter gossypii]WPU98588.1 hypothetical protein SNE26_21440 [Mucilaginibacter gossypii]
MKPQRKLKLILLFATLMFVAKPFIGFVQFNRQHPPQKINIHALEKAFSKRMIQYKDGSLTKMTSIQRQLTEPGIKYYVTFLFSLLSFFTSILVGSKRSVIHNQSVKRLLLLPAYLLNRQIIV